MKRLAFLAGTRRKGNTEKLLNIYLNKTNKNNDTKIYNLLDLNFSGCIACYGCEKTGKCVLKDDLTEIYKEIDEAEEIIFASPVYFNSVTALGKKFIDRMQSYWSKKYLLKIKDEKEKTGVFISTAGAPNYNNQFLGSNLVGDYFFRSLNCSTKTYIMVPDTDNIKINEEDERFNILENQEEYLDKEILIIK